LILIQVKIASASFLLHRWHLKSFFIICKAFSYSARLLSLRAEWGCLAGSQVLLRVGLAAGCCCTQRRALLF